MDNDYVLRTEWRRVFYTHLFENLLWHPKVRHVQLCRGQVLVPQGEAGQQTNLEMGKEINECSCSPLRCMCFTLTCSTGSSAPAGGSMAITGAREPSAQFLTDLSQGCDRSCCHISWSSSAVMTRSTGVDGRHAADLVQFLAPVSLYRLCSLVKSSG